MRLIDVDAMHKFVEDKVAEGKDGWANGVPYEWAYALTAADMQPTIDAEPVQHGYWIEDHMGWKCSCCRTVFKDELERIKSYDEHDMPKRCPECGAKMDGEIECSDG